MNLEWMRIAMTVVAFVTFIGIVWWAWHSSNQHDFEAAALSILGEESAGHDERRQS
jgi:cbb3-type cytochrome oxidase subunit 3